MLLLPCVGRDLADYIENAVWWGRPAIESTLSNYNLVIASAVFWFCVALMLLSLAVKLGPIMGPY